MKIYGICIKTNKKEHIFRFINTIQTIQYISEIPIDINLGSVFGFIIENNKIKHIERINKVFKDKLYLSSVAKESEGFYKAILKSEDNKRVTTCFLNTELKKHYTLLAQKKIYFMQYIINNKIFVDAVDPAQINILT